MTSLFPSAALVACLTDIIFLRIAVLILVNAIFMRINFKMGILTAFHRQLSIEDSLLSGKKNGPA